MKKISIQHIIIITFLNTLISGCRSNDDYSKLGLAGSKYIEAVNLLLDESIDTRINLTSEQILANDGKKATITAQQYQDTSSLDRGTIISMNRVAKHNQLVKKYFTLLQELASSDAPQKAQAEIEKVATNLTAVGNLIAKSRNPSRSTLLGSGANFIIRLQIKDALKQELEKRGLVIINELKIQEEELKYIGKILLKEKRELIQKQENRLVVKPITAPTPIDDEEQWIKTRYRIVKMNVMSEKFDSASSTLNDFRNIFQSFLEGRSDLTSINNFLIEVEEFTNLVNYSK